MNNTLYAGASLRNLIDTLGPVKKAEKTPTSRKLREEAGEPIITTDSILIYACGYAVYENESGRTVDSDLFLALVDRIVMGDQTRLILRDGTEWTV